MNTRQVVLAAVVLGCVCAGVVWWLESFNREKLINAFHLELEKWPTFKPGPVEGA